MKIQESAEDYLEAILILNKAGTVRSIDVAHYLQFSKPSVSNAMKALRASGHIVTDKDGSITLTNSGEAVAKRIYERHCLMTDWLVGLGVNPKTAAEDSCRIEHDISEETFCKIKEYINAQGK